MILTLRRIAKRPAYTIGRLYIDGEYFCDTLEDTDRGLRQGQSVDALLRMKIKGSTAIPAGRYKITLSVVSPRFGQRAQYKRIGGRLPRLLDVPAFDGVLIHIGNTPEDTEGCILVGENKVVGQVINSTATFYRLADRLNAAEGDVWIEIRS
ncbi:MAG: hypothetical protein J6K19_00995 [Prevotella sp.]|nr:hypothetical protein [Prevotella sp.]